MAPGMTKADVYSVQEPVDIKRRAWLPRIRLFGTTSGGQKCCMHVHGVCVRVTPGYVARMRLRAIPLTDLALVDGRTHSRVASKVRIAGNVAD
jgi:hypothetical protein